MTWLGQTKPDDQPLKFLQQWRLELADYEYRFQKKIPDEDRIIAVKAIMPEHIFGAKGHFKGKTIGTYDALMTSITDYLEDRGISSNTLAAGQVRNLGDDDEFEQKLAVLTEELNALQGQRFR